MPALEASYPFSISQSENPGPTLFGLPGDGSGNATYMNINLSGTIKVYDDESVTMDLSGSITHPNLLPANYPVFLIVNPNDWNWTWTSSGPNIPSGGYEVASATVPVGSPGTRGPFNWDINVSNVSIGNIEMYGASSSGDSGIVYFGGTGNYEVDDPIYPDPMPITIPGFVAYLDYYVAAIRKSGTMQSCNRSGGSSLIRKSGSWSDVKNVERGTGTDHGFYRHNGGWEKLPKTGANS